MCIIVSTKYADEVKIKQATHCIIVRPAIAISLERLFENKFPKTGSLLRVSITYL